MSLAEITTDGNTLAVRFDSFGLDNYELFLRSKGLPENQIAYDWETDAYTLTAPARFAPLLGVAAVTERERLPVAEHL